MKEKVGMLLCLVGIIALAASEMLINWSAAAIVGATEVSAWSLKAVAIGVVFTSVALGAIGFIITGFWGKFFIVCTVILTGLVQATFSIQGSSIDYASNDHSGEIQGARQSANKDNVEDLQKEKELIEADMPKQSAECEKDKWWHDCNKAKRRLTEINQQITAARNDTVDSVRSEEVDITEAIDDHAGIPGRWIELAAIWSRAFAIPPAISLLTFGFWAFSRRTSGVVVTKKPQGAANSTPIQLHKMTKKR